GRPARGSVLRGRASVRGFGALRGGRTPRRQSGRGNRGPADEKRTPNPGAAMKAYRIDHVGVAVPSIDEALAVYRALGLSVERREEAPSQKVIAAFLPVGDSRVELLEATSAESPIAKFLARRGGGIHHVCFAVDDLDAALAELSARGFRLIH